MDAVGCALLSDMTTEIYVYPAFEKCDVLVILVELNGAEKHEKKVVISKSGEKPSNEVD
jgi:hypothetical protein